MPSCGKTTIAKKLSKLLNKDLLDSDTLIENKIGMKIKDYIKNNGEAKFREVEKEVIEEISKKNNSIISTGGGVILNKTNINNLKQNSIIVFVDRALELKKL